MTDYERKISDPSWGKGEQVEVEVRGNVQVDKGDLMFLDRIDGLRGDGSSTADHRAYPFSKLAGVTGTLAGNRYLARRFFVGVAGWHSDSGVTEKISIYTTGLFRYPLKHSKHVRAGSYVIPAGSVTRLYDQKVATTTSATSDYIGVACKGGVFQSTVDMNLWTLFKIFNIDDL